MAYIIKNMRITASDFNQMLTEKQDILVSGINIKTIDHSSLLGQGNIVVSPRRYSFDLTTLEKQLHDDAISSLEEINPNHKYMSFGFITDLHESKLGGIYGPEGVYTTALPSIKLLGSIAYDYGLDAIFVGGDLSTGGDLTYNEYDDMLSVVQNYFIQYMPVPYFVTEGNHDRRYSSSVAIRDNQTWNTFARLFNYPVNTDVVYIQNLIADKYLSNTYYIDFDAYKVRIVCSSAYERQQQAAENSSTFNAKPYAQDIYDALQFPEEKDCREWTVCSFSHTGVSDMRFLNGYLNGSKLGKGAGTDQLDLPAFNGGKKGLACVGEIRGHFHTQSRAIEGSVMNIVRVANAYATPPQIDTVNAYCFSIFTIDTDRWKLVEQQVGRYNETYELDIAHNDITI